MKYLPLPKELRLGFSKIHDIGLFAKEKINRGSNLGISHIQIGKELFRTPMGGFINHSDKPNCVKVKSLLTRQEWNHRTYLPDNKYDLNFTKWNLVTIKDIEAGEELTVKYTFYKI